jgi:serine/threonine protein kinase
MEITICPACRGGCPARSFACPSCGVMVADAPVSSGDSLTGLRVGGKYELVEHLGAGSMGQVYRAVHRDLGNSVAVKLLVEGDKNKDWVVRFRGEAKAISRLSHPHILSVIDFGEDLSGISYLITEYIRGRSLGAVLAREGSLPLRRAARILCQVLAALEESHESGVIHRDLKPENIMVTDHLGGEDFVKVVDFGIADLIDERPWEAAGPETIIGTPAYISPEQIRGEKASCASDIYAAGIILFEMLTGSLPFPVDSPDSAMDGHLRQPVPRLEDVRPGVEDAERVQALLEAALAKDPLDRFPSAAAFLRGLEDLKQGNPPSGRRCSACGGQLGIHDSICPVCSAPAESHPRIVMASCRETVEIFPEASVSPSRGPDPSWRCPCRDGYLGCLPRLFPSIERPAVAEGILRLIGGALQVLHLTGPPGMGKTAAAGDACRHAAEAGVEVVWSEPHSSRLPVPWEPIRSAVTQVLGLPARPSLHDLDGIADSCRWRRGSPAGLLDLFGRVGPLSDAGPPLRRLEIVLTALEVLLAPSEVPRLLVFDDVDAFDEPSRKVVLRLAEECRGAGVRLLLTGEERLFDPGPARMVVPLEPIPAGAILDRMEPGIGNLTLEARRIAVHLVEDGGGNPLWILQSLALASESGAVGPRILPEIFAMRVHRLPGPLRSALEALAVLGMEASPGELAIVSGGESIGASDVEFLARHHFLDGGGRGASRDCRKAVDGRMAPLPGGALRLAHPGMVASIRKKILAEVRQEMSARAFRHLQGTGAPDLLLARLALEAGEFSHALELLRRAGDHALDALDAETAAGLYRRAIEVHRLRFPDREESALHLDLTACLGEALLACGDLAPCEEVVRNIAGSRSLIGAPAARIGRTRAMIRLRRGDLRGAADALRLALREPGGDCSLRVEMLLDLGRLLERLEGPEEAAREIRKHLPSVLSGRSGRDDKKASCRWLLGVLLARLAGRSGAAGKTEAPGLIGEALLDAERCPSSIGQGVCHHLLAEFLEDVHRMGDAGNHREACRRILAPLGERPGLAGGLAEALAGDLETTERIRRLAVDLDGDLEWYGIGETASVRD